MSHKTPTDTEVVRNEEKVANLIAFIKRDLERRAEGDGGSDQHYLLIARSANSPVVQALLDLANELKAANLGMRAVLSTIEMASEPMVSEGSDATMTQGLQSLRVVRDHRLFDVHEQLILNDTCVWIGDILRREPSKCDAFEQFSEGCADTVNWARTSFERLWDSAEPIVGDEDCTEMSLSDAIALASLSVDASQSGDAATTRH